MVVSVQPLLPDGSIGKWKGSIVTGGDNTGTVLATEATVDAIKIKLNEIATAQATSSLQGAANTLLTSISNSVASNASEATMQLIKSALDSINVKSDQLALIKNAIDLSKVVADNQLTALNAIQSLINSQKHISSWMGVYQDKMGVFTIYYNQDGTFSNIDFRSYDGGYTPSVDLQYIADPPFAFSQIFALVSSTPQNIVFPFETRNFSIKNNGTYYVVFDITFASGSKRFFLEPSGVFKFSDSNGPYELIEGLASVATVNDPITSITPGNSSTSDSLSNIPTALGDTPVKIEILND